jgi:MYND finger
MATWDRFVYAECVERIDHSFFWCDVHWVQDKSELLRRSKEWNRALEAYRDDAGLMGEERDRVIARHTANPRGPCGRVGCDAFEREVKEFQRCSRCKSIGYCSQTCQKMDWAKHRKSCELK